MQPGLYINLIQLILTGFVLINSLISFIIFQFKPPAAQISCRALATGAAIQFVITVILSPIGIVCGPRSLPWPDPQLKPPPAGSAGFPTRKR